MTTLDAHLSINGDEKRIAVQLRKATHRNKRRNLVFRYGSVIKKGKRTTLNKLAPPLELKNGEKGNGEKLRIWLEEIGHIDKINLVKQKYTSLHQ